MLLQRSVPALLLLLVVLIGCSREQAPSGPAFDIPALMHKRIGEVERRLGAGTGTVTTGSLPNSPGRKSWSKDGYVLTVDYTPTSGRITGFALHPEDASRSFKEEEKAEFLKAGNLADNDPRYEVEMQEHPDQVLRFTGARIAPAPLTYEVKLRIKSVGRAVGARYSVTGGGASTAPPAFLTIPPWEQELTASTGALLTLEAAPFADPRKRNRPPSFIVQVEIEVNGKVVQRASSAGGVARAQWELD